MKCCLFGYHFSTFEINLLHHTRKTLVCCVLIIRFVIDCLELSRNYSESYPFNPFISCWISKFFKADLWRLMASKLLVVKQKWDHSESAHRICYFFVLLNFPLSRRVSTLPFWNYNNLSHLALWRWPSITLLYDSSFFSWILFFMIFHKIEFIFCFKETVSWMKNNKFDWTKSNTKGEQYKRESSLQQFRTCWCVN